LLGDEDAAENVQLTKDQVLGARLFVLGMLDATRNEVRERSRKQSAVRLPMTEHLKDAQRQQDLIARLLSESVDEYLTNLFDYEQHYYEDQGPWQQIFWSIEIRFRRLDRRTGSDEIICRGIEHLEKIAQVKIAEDLEEILEGSVVDIQDLVAHRDGIRGFIYKESVQLLPALLLGEWFAALEGSEAMHRRGLSLTEQGTRLVETCYELLDPARRRDLEK